MRLFKVISSALAAATLVASDPTPRQENEFVGYLLSTFSDPTPQVAQYLSTADAPLSFSPINGGSPVLTSNVGTRGVRDIFLTTNSARSEYFVIATDLDINADGFNWDKATRQGSRGLVVWSSTNLVDWSAPALRIIEADTAGMAWAPSVVWDDAEQLYYVFWSSRQYASSDTGHTGVATLDCIRYATTTDFVTFSTPADYVTDSSTGLIDQEFQYLGTPGAYVRFLKNENLLRVYQESTTNGIFGSWTRSGYTNEGSPFEGAASFEDILDPSVYYLLLDNYAQYVPYSTSDILANNWEPAGAPGFPSGLKHGNVVQLTQAEFDAISAAYS